ncbi:hypothetical protein N7494_005192 [Penicillium frequentans]|uniref:Uncharacterized protein n=1 Tax=Penicillium frequentans TaxID=3151616 RepID=A0AAD6CXM9_9EURO|nr:hypothetical protein N7494_005192 [Penicillium glabrum]
MRSQTGCPVFFLDDTTFTGIARPAFGPECESGKKKSDGFRIPLSPDFGVVVRSLPAPGRTAQPRRIQFGLPNED